MYFSFHKNEGINGILPVQHGESPWQSEADERRCVMLNEQ